MYSNNRQNSIRSRRSNGRNRQPFCSFCKNMGKNPLGHCIKKCPELKKIKCPNCGKGGHTIRYCPFIEKCNFCEKVGHTEDRCFFKPKNQIPKCSGCNKFGHLYEDCYYVDQEEKDKIRKERKDLQEKERVEREERNKRDEEFSKKGFTYSEVDLVYYKKQLEENKDYIPWVIYDDNESCNVLKTTRRERERLDDMKYQISMLA